MPKFFIILLNFLILVSTINTMGIKNEKDAMMYLNQYGYMENLDSKSKENPMMKGMMMFQRVAGVKATGKFDKETMKKMNMLRCGNKERIDLMLNERPTTLGIKGWGYSDIHYRIKNFPKSGLSSQVVRWNVQKAFKLWEDVANIISIEVDPSDHERHVEIDISFETDDHGDGYMFGQKAMGQAVAHAFFPGDTLRIQGDIHFDNERGWTVDTKDGLNFFQIIVHEIGHALGLDHSMIQDSVMHMLVKSEYQFNPEFHLHEEDIRRIRSLYGKKSDDDTDKTLLESESNIHFQNALPNNQFYAIPFNQIHYYNRLFSYPYQKRFRLQKRQKL